MPPDESQARKQEARQALWQLFVAGFCMMQVMMLTVPIYTAPPGDIAPDHLALLQWAAWVLTLPVLLFSSRPYFTGAWNALKQRRIDMDVPVALGIAVTFIAGTAATFEPQGVFGREPYLDSLTMFVTILLVGRWLERRARARNTEALESLMHVAPQSADVLDAQGQVRAVPVSELRVGDRVRVTLGQTFPGDGVLLEGATQVDESMLTGESRALYRETGATVVGGTLNVGVPVVVQMSAVGADTRQRQIAQLVERALTQRPTFVRSVDRWAAPFVWVVLGLAASAAAAWAVVDPARAVWVAISVLIVTCPCALSIAVPASLLAAASRLARRGVLIQRLDAIEALARVDVACFDKTGTLTHERPVLASTTVTLVGDRDALLARAASLASLSAHPLSKALAQALASSTVPWTDVHEHPGCGVEAWDACGVRWRLGSPAWAGVAASSSSGRLQLAFAAQDGLPQRQALFEFDEAVRPDAAQALDELRRDGLSVRVLSGDLPQNVLSLAARLGIAEAEGGAKPEDKLQRLSQWQGEGHSVLMVGDGVNDGPILARADASFAMAQASALAQQRADFVVLSNRLSEVPHARALAKRTMRIVRQNLVWAAVYNAACVPLALAGMLPPWAAGTGMAASSLLVVLNALRLAR